MKKSVFATIILILSSILFGFLLTIMPKYLPFTEMTLNNKISSIIIISMFCLFFIMVIGLYIHSHFLVSKSKFINTMVPFRTYDSLRENEMTSFYNNMKKIVSRTTKSLIYVTYPINIYDESTTQSKMYTDDYYKTKAGKDLKGFHKFLLKQIDKMIGSKQKTQFKMFIQNVSRNTEKVNETNNKKQNLDKNTQAFFDKVKQYKKQINNKSKYGSTVDYHNIYSNSEVIAVIVDNRYMLMLTKVLGKYVTSFVKDQSVVKEFVVDLFSKIPESL